MIRKKTRRAGRPQPGEKVTVRALPPGFTDDLPAEDQEAIAEAIGKPLTLNRYETDGRAEIEFTDKQGVIHFIYLQARFLDAVDE